MNRYVGRGRRFRSIRAWHIASGVKLSTLHEMYQNGYTPDAQKIVDLARAIPVNPKEAFIEVGWFDPEEDLGNRHVAKLAEIVGALDSEDDRDLVVETAQLLAARLRSRGAGQDGRPGLHSVDRPE